MSIFHWCFNLMDVLSFHKLPFVTIIFGSYLSHKLTGFLQNKAVLAAVGSAAGAGGVEGKLIAVLESVKSVSAVVGHYFILMLLCCTPRRYSFSSVILYELLNHHVG